MKGPKFRIATWRGAALQTLAPLFEVEDQKTAKSRGTDTWNYYEGARSVTVTNLDTGKIVYHREAKAGFPRLSVEAVVPRPAKAV